MSRSVKYLIPAFDINMGGIILKQALPTTKVPQVDPFLLLHHGSFKFNNKAAALHQGVGPHPHRGFTPVTFVIDGEIHHRDSRGNSQIAKKGEVQWMNAGAGIIHSERPTQQLVDNNGRQEIIQLWINSPSNKKMLPPKYQYTDNEKIRKFKSADGNISNKLIAGSYGGINGEIDTDSELIIIWSSSEKGGKISYDIPTSHNLMIYVIAGSIKIDGYGPVEKKSLVVFENDNNKLGLSCEPGTAFLCLSGEPLNEKLVQQGPFVMNSETQILEAMRDYQMGKMGVLIEDK